MKNLAPIIEATLRGYDPGLPEEQFGQFDEDIDTTTKFFRKLLKDKYDTFRGEGAGHFDAAVHARTSTVRAMLVMSTEDK